MCSVSVNTEIQVLASYSFFKKRPKTRDQSHKDDELLSMNQHYLVHSLLGLVNVQIIFLHCQFQHWFQNDTVLRPDIVVTHCNNDINSDAIWLIDFPFYCWLKSTFPSLAATLSFSLLMKLFRLPTSLAWRQLSAPCKLRNYQTTVSSFHTSRMGKPTASDFLSYQTSFEGQLDRKI